MNKGNFLIYIIFIFLLSGHANANWGITDHNQTEILKKIEEGWSFLEKSPEEAVLIANEAWHQASEVNNREGMAKALLLAGYGLNQQKDHENALIRLRRALALLGDDKKHRRETGQCYFGQGFALYHLSDIDSSLFFLNKALEYFHPDRHKSDMAHTEWRIALAYWQRGMYKEGIEHIQKAQILFEEVKDDLNLSRVYNSKGAILWGMANYEKALEFFFNALTINEKEKINQDQNILIYNNIGLVYFDWNDNENALKYFKRAEASMAESHHPIGDAYTWLNLGTYYLRTGETEKALDFLMKARDEYHNEKDENGVSLSKIRIGEGHLQNGDFSLARLTLEEAIQNSRETRNKHRESTAYYYLAKNEMLQERYKEALDYSLKSLEISENGQYKELSNMLYEQLAEIHEKLGNHPDALNMLKKAAEVKDDIYKERIAVQYNLMDLTYENEKKAYENERLKRENLLNRRTIRYQYLIFILIGAFMILLVIFYLKLSKKKKELEQANHMKDKVFSIVAHDIRGPVGTLNSMIDILVNEDHGMNYKDVLASYQPIIASSYNMLENLLVWAKSNLGKLETSPVIHPLYKSLNEIIALFSHISGNKGISIISEIPEHIRVYADKILLQTVLRNIINNAIKFTPRNGEIKIKTQISEKMVIVSVTDNGIGIPQEVQPTILKGYYHSPGTNKENGSGLGLMICQELALKIGGEIWFTSTQGKGSTFFISIPVIPH